MRLPSSSMCAVFVLVLSLLASTPASAQTWGPNDLEAAIAAAPDGGVIELPAGVHDFKTDWNPPSPLGKNLTLRGTGQTVIQGTTDLAVNGGRFLRTRADLFMEGIELQGFKEGVKFTPDAGTTLRASFERVHFVGVKIGLLAGGHLNSDTGFEYLLVRDCEFSDGNWGIDIRMPTYRNVHIESNLFTDFVDRGINLGSTVYDPDEKRAQIFIRDNTIKGVGVGSTIQPIGIIVHGNYCFLTSNYVEDVNADNSGESAGLYTKCMYSKVLGNTVVDSSASGTLAFNGAITIKGKERDEMTGPFGFGAMVSDNHVIFTDLTRAKRVAFKVHAAWVYGSDNIIEEATDEKVVSPNTLVNVDFDNPPIWRP